jgi:hypothetical protein
MFASRSLFQSAFKDSRQPLVRGLSKSRPFLNTWAPSPSLLQQRKLFADMASATSFYDFKPLDSKSPRL